MNILEVMDSPELFGPHFKALTWGPWRAFLAALFGLPMDEEAATLYRACTGRQTVPVEQFEEATLICGRRAGKSRTLATIAIYLATFRAYEEYLAPGEVATVGILAADRRQARSIFRYANALLTQTPALAPMVVSQSGELIELNNRVVIEISTASFRSTRGYTYAACIADEIAFFRSDESSANPDREILRALRPGLGTIPGAPLLIASSPYAKKGVLYESFKKDWGNDASSVLCWKASTLTMFANPRLAKMRDADFVKDAQSARAEWDAHFRDDLADFVTLEMLEAVTCPGRSELPPIPNVRYVAFCDPSGGVSDSMTLAIAHLEGDKGVLDAVLVVEPPFDPADAVTRCAELMRRYNVARVKSDRYAGQWVVSQFASAGITVEHSERAKSDLYLDLLPLITSGSVELLDNPRLVNELAGLERRTARSGRDSVDHSPNAHDDLGNSVAGVLVNVMLDRREPLIRREALTRAAPPDETAYVQNYHSVCWIGDDGKAAYCIFANRPRRKDQLLVLDFERVQWRPGIFAELCGRMAQLRADTMARDAESRFYGCGSILWVRDRLEGDAFRAMQKAFANAEFPPANRYHVAVKPIAQTWFNTPMKLTVTAQEMVDGGRVRFSSTAEARSEKVSIRGAFTALPGENEMADPLRVALFLGINFLGKEPR